MNRFILPLLVAITLATGAAVVLQQKWMNRNSEKTCSNCPKQIFKAPMWQTLLMFSGREFVKKEFAFTNYSESLALGAYTFDKYVTRKGWLNFSGLEDPLAKPTLPRAFWCIPATLDLLGSTACNIAFTITFVSTVQILRNSNVVMCALLQTLYLRRALRLSEWVGIFIITVGMTMSGIFAMVTSDPSTASHSGYSWVGIILALVGTAFISFQMIFEERLMRKYFASPVAGVGYQGLIGICLATFGLLVSDIIGYERFATTWHQVQHNKAIRAASISYFLTVSIFNMAGMSVTKLSGAVLKSVLYAARSALVWGLELGLRWNSFDWLNFGGLIILIFGFIIYDGRTLDSIKNRTTDENDRKSFWSAKQDYYTPRSAISTLSV